MSSLPSEPKPRVWTPFLLLLVALAGTIAIGIGVAVIGAVFLQIETGAVDENALETWILEDPIAFILNILATQVALVIAVCSATHLSEVPWRERLGVNWGTRSLKWLPLWIVASLGFGRMGEFLVDPNDSPAAVQMAETMASQSLAYGLLVTLIGSLLPGVFEELLFRGYLQVRLLKRWSPWVVIPISGSLFAAFHMEPQYIAMVFPIGLWLGLLAWRLGGTLPGIVCHIINNVLAWGLMILLPRIDADPAAGSHPIVDGFLFLSAAIAVFVLLRPHRDGLNPS